MERNEVVEARNESSPSSPVQTASPKRYTQRESQRNYFKKDKDSKALVSSMRKLANSLEDSRDVTEELRNAKNISQHD